MEIETNIDFLFVMVETLNKRVESLNSQFNDLLKLSTRVKSELNSMDVEGTAWKKKIDSLCKLHNVHIELETTHNPFPLTVSKVVTEHPELKANTETAGYVSLDELAQLVIDGKPLTRSKSIQEEIKPKCCNSTVQEEKGE